MICVIFFFFKQKTAYEMRISDWSSDVCSSDLRRARRCLSASVPSLDPPARIPDGLPPPQALGSTNERRLRRCPWQQESRWDAGRGRRLERQRAGAPAGLQLPGRGPAVSATLQHQIVALRGRSEEHTSELQSLMRNSY